MWMSILGMTERGDPEKETIKQNKDQPSKAKSSVPRCIFIY